MFKEEQEQAYNADNYECRRLIIEGDNRCRAAKRGGNINYRNGLRLRKSYVEELVMQVASVRLEGVFALRYSCEEYYCGIYKRQCKDERRSHGGHKRRALEKSENGKACEYISEEHGAAVAHEYCRRAYVIGEEAERRAADCRRDNGAYGLAHKY